VHESAVEFIGVFYRCDHDMESSVKASKSTRNARWLAWIFAGLTIAMMGVGLAFQIITAAPFLGAPFLVHFSEVIGLSGFAVVGALMAARHPWHPIGWVWLLISFSFGRDHFAWGYAYYGYIAHPGSLPIPEIMIVLLYWLGRGTLGLFGLTLLLLLFPTGKPLSRRWSLLAWIAVGGVASGIPLSLLAPAPIGSFPFPTDLFAVTDATRATLGSLKMITRVVSLLCFLGAAFSLLTRLVQSRGVERQQLKWFVYAAAFLPPAFLLIFLGEIQQSSINLLGAILGVTATISMSAASAIAIFRYRLWDIDLIIRRTLMYGLLSSALVLVYFSSIVLLQRSLQILTGQGSTLAIVASTLIIAALFSPLRQRIQDFIDRRFYRRKYNAEKIVAAFGAGLRQEVDIEQISQHLAEAVEETLQPESLSLWLREQGP